MADEPFNLVLEHLRARRADIGTMRQTQLEHGIKLDRLEESLAGVKRDGIDQATPRTERSLDRVTLIRTGT